jgi:hypothetical protein
MNLPTNAFQKASFIDCCIWADASSDNAFSVLRSVNGECHGNLPSDEHTSYSVDQRRRDGAVRVAPHQFDYLPMHILWYPKDDCWLPDKGEAEELPVSPIVPVG